MKVKAKVAINRFELDGRIYRAGDIVEVDESKFPTSSLIFIEKVILEEVKEKEEETPAPKIKRSKKR